MATHLSVSYSTNIPIRSELDTDTLKVGVIGYGYWGPNIVRNLQALAGARGVGICDKNPAALRRAEGVNHGTRLGSARPTFATLAAAKIPRWRCPSQRPAGSASRRAMAMSSGRMTSRAVFSVAGVRGPGGSAI